MDAARANTLRLDPTSTRGHYESWFLRANDPTRPVAFWIRYTLFVPAGIQGAVGPHAPRMRALPVGEHPGPSGRPHAELFAIWFDGVGHHHVAVRESFDLGDCDAAPTGLRVRMGGSTLDEDSAIGSARSGKHSIAWDLELSGGGSPILLMPKDRYDARFPKAKTVVARPLAKMRGVVEVDGVPHGVDDWLGSQNHSWGERHTDGYAWGQVAGFDEEPDTFLECGTGHASLGPIRSPPVTLMVLRRPGSELALTSLVGGLRARGRYGVGHLELSGTTEGARVTARFEAPLADFVGLAYDNPPGGVKSCLNTKIATATVTIEKEGRTVTLRATRRAALELVSDEPSPNVPLLR